MVDHTRDIVTADPDRERMVLGKRALGKDRRHDGDPDQLGKSDEFRCGLAPEHALADINERVLRAKERRYRG